MSSKREEAQSRKKLRVALKKNLTMPMSEMMGLDFRPVVKFEGEIKKLNYSYKWL